MTRTESPVDRQREQMHRRRVRLLADEVMVGKAWGKVLLPDGYDGKCGATLEEAEEALCLVIDRTREQRNSAETDRDDAVGALDRIGTRVNYALGEIRDDKYGSVTVEAALLEILKEIEPWCPEGEALDVS